MVIFLTGGHHPNIESAKEIAEAYTNFDATLIGIDYHNFGESSSIKPIPWEDDLCKDAQETFNYVKNRYPYKKIIVHGYELVCFPAVKIAQNNEIEKLVLQAIKSIKNDLEIQTKNDKNSGFFKKICSTIIIKLLAYGFDIEPEIKLLHKKIRNFQFLCVMKKTALHYKKQIY